MTTHLVLTFSGSKIPVNEEQHDRLRNLGLKDNISIDGHFIKGSSISEIIPIEDYYHDHPKERPAPGFEMIELSQKEKDDMDERIREAQKPLTRERYLHSARSTLKGLRQYIDGSSNPTPTALLIAKNLAQKIKDANEGVGSFAKSQKELIKQLN